MNGIVDDVANMSSFNPTTQSTPKRKDASILVSVSITADLSEIITELGDTEASEGPPRRD